MTLSIFSKHKLTGKTMNTSRTELFQLRNPLTQEAFSFGVHSLLQQDFVMHTSVTTPPSIESIGDNTVRIKLGISSQLHVKALKVQQQPHSVYTELFTGQVSLEFRIDRAALTRMPRRMNTVVKPESIRRCTYNLKTDSFGPDVELTEGPAKIKGKDSIALVVVRDSVELFTCASHRYRPTELDAQLNELVEASKKDMTVLVDEPGYTLVDQPVREYLTAKPIEVYTRR